MTNCFLQSPDCLGLLGAEKDGQCHSRANQNPDTGEENGQSQHRDRAGVAAQRRPLKEVRLDLFGWLG